MARPRRLHEAPLHFHVSKEIRGWIGKWAKRHGRTVAEVCREILAERYAAANSK